MILQLRSISQCKNLNHLTLTSDGTDKITITENFLESLEQLELLEFGDEIDYTNEFPKSKKLKSLKLNSKRTSNKTINSIKNFNELVELKTHFKTKNQLMLIDELKKLKKISIQNNFNFKNFNQSIKTDQIEDLELFSVNFDEDFEKWILKLTNLKKVTLHIGQYVTTTLLKQIYQFSLRLTQRGVIISIYNSYGSFDGEKIIVGNHCNRLLHLGR